MFPATRCGAGSQALFVRGLLPNDLKLHYFLHWFAFYNGNILRTGRELHIHRNTIEGHFREFGFSGKAYTLRILGNGWRRKTRKPFFRRLFSSFTAVTANQNSRRKKTGA